MLQISAPRKRVVLDLHSCWKKYVLYPAAAKAVCLNQAQTTVLRDNDLSELF